MRWASCETSWRKEEWSCGWPGFTLRFGDMLERAGLAQSIGEERIYPSVHAGVQAYLEVVNRG